MKKIALCVSALILLVTSFAQSSGKIVLNKGQKFIQETSGNVLITQEMMGQSMESKIDIKSANTIEVADVKDTSYSLITTVTKMKMNMSAMGQDMSYDSDKKDNDSTIGKSMEKILNNPKNVEISKTGKVINKEESEKKDTEADANMMTGMIDNLLNNSSGEASTLMFQVIPEKAKVGYSWGDSVNNDELKSNTTYTIKELKGNDATVTVKGSMQVSKKAQAQNMEFTSNSTGGFTGELVIDTKTGVVKQRNTTLETTGSVEAMGQQIPMKTKVTSEITIESM